jgi:hypothetical protein
MADITIEVPSGLVRRVLVSLLHELAPLAEAVWLRAGACIADEDDVHNLRGDLSLLQDAANMLDGLETWLDDGDVSARVTGHPELLVDVVSAAIADELTNLRETCVAYRDGTADAADVVTCLEGVGGLVRVLVAVCGDGEREHDSAT